MLSSAPARAVVLLLSLAVLPPVPALAHGATAGSRPLLPSALRLQHRKPAEIIALLAREAQPGAAGESVPRAARAGNAGALLPAGIDAVLRTPSDEVVLVGSEGRFAEMAECIRLLDVPVRKTGPDREQVVLTLRQSNPLRVRSAVLRLVPAGSAKLSGRQLVLEGTPAWLHRALREVVRAELGQAPETAEPVL